MCKERLSPASDPLNGSEANPLEDGCAIKIENSYTLTRKERRNQRDEIRARKRTRSKIDSIASPTCKTKKPVELRRARPRQAELLFECDFCGKQFDRKSLLASHMKQHRHRCKTCNQTFRLRKDLKQHTEQVHGPVLYPCTICEYKSNNRWTLKDHFIRKHTSSFDYSCSVCGKQFKIKNDMVQHAKQMHSNAPPIICTVCGHACKSVPSLKAHMKYRHYKPAFECSLCKRCMTTQYNLDQHLLWHEKKEKVVCPTCGKTFGQKRDLDLHLRIHEGIRPFSCPVCGKKFPRRTAQEQHILIHTGQRPYTCDICGQKFAQKPGLICHRKRHPGPLPPLPVISIRKIITDFTQGLSDATIEKKEN
ncbi:oocyte zinc finger protein XlCOF6.1-like [Apis cerana]|uniref:oocyte zinc finger protein XlCOF6.1-like n=1 Tax=Apis cerana TaxID=7461 RepID=UPI002B234AF3|nr:oocyte zinc finger protein XlCOF6.1-like [Apis cerana]